MNLCVFSKSLFERWHLLCRARKETDNCESISEVIEKLKCENCLSILTVLYDPYTINCEVNKNISYRHATNKHLRNLTTWIISNIVFKQEDNLHTVGVKLRIFTSMLNKLVLNGHLTVEDSSCIHYNVINNIWKLKSDINSDLPF